MSFDVYSSDWANRRARPVLPKGLSDTLRRNAYYIYIYIYIYTQHVYSILGTPLRNLASPISTVYYRTRAFYFSTFLRSVYLTIEESASGRLVRVGEGASVGYDSTRREASLSLTSYSWNCNPLYSISIVLSYRWPSANCMHIVVDQTVQRLYESPSVYSDRASVTQLCRRL